MTESLVLHCGGARASWADVEAVKTPQRTATWVPIPHAELVRQVRRTIEATGLEVAGEAHALARGGLRYFGLLEIAGGSEFALIVGVRNSHDQSYPAALALGSRVFVCDNLAFSGEVVLARRHTTFIERDLPQLVSRAVGQLLDLRGTQEERFELYKRTPIDPVFADHLIVECLRRRIVNLQRLDDLAAEYQRPRHPEFATEHNLWRFANAVTEVLKGSPIFGVPRVTQALYGLLDSVVAARGGHHG